MEKPQHQGSRITVAFTKVVVKVAPEASKAASETLKAAPEAGGVNGKT